MAFTEIQSYKRRLYLPQAGEGSYNEGDDHTSVTWVVDPINTEQLRVSQRVLNDRMKSTGKEFPRKQIPTESILNVQPVQLWASFNSLAWALGFGLGRDTMDSSGTNRTHAFSMCANNAFPGSFGALDFINGPTYTAATDFAHAGVYLDSFSLSWGTEDLVAQTLNVGGSGLRTTPSNVTESGLSPFAGLGYILANKVRVWLAAAAAEGDSAWTQGWAPHSSAGIFANGGVFTNISEYARDFTFTYSNGYTRTRSGGASTGSGVVGVQPRLGRNRMVSLQCNLLQLGASGFSKALLDSTYGNNAEYCILIEFVSDAQITGTSPAVYEGGLIAMPLVSLEETPGSGGDLADLRDESMTFSAKAEAISVGTNYDACYGYVENGTVEVYNRAP